MLSAFWRSTATNWLIPFSGMVIPYSLSILDIVKAWWVTITKRVLVIFVNSSNKLQNLVTLASSKGASTSSSTQIGEGLVRKTAKIKDKAVKACSPPESKFMDCNLLDELTKITNTRFVIVTHHALTMSKMDILYGLTMPEKGISQLVAVDLQKAESMVA